MENKINIAELLKDCPKGMELYSPLCGECRILNIYDGLGFDVICGDDTVYNFSYDGRYNIMGECCIFPSKENRDWSKFQRPFKDGDIIYTDNFIAIFSHIAESGTVWYHCYYCISTKNFNAKHSCGIGNINYDEFRLATEEEKQKLFDAIKDNDYKWNPETKILSKLVQPNFKVGNEIEKYGYKYTITEIKDNYYLTKCGNKISLDYQDDFSLVSNKFDINTLKPLKSEVLVRDSINVIWKPSFWGKYIEDSNYKYLTTNGSWKQCIPYEGNEHLLGTSNNCDDFYKIWE